MRKYYWLKSHSCGEISQTNQKKPTELTVHLRVWKWCLWVKKVYLPSLFPSANDCPSIKIPLKMFLLRPLQLLWVIFRVSRSEIKALNHVTAEMRDIRHLYTSKTRDKRPLSWEWKLRHLVKQLGQKKRNFTVGIKAEDFPSAILCVTTFK